MGRESRRLSNANYAYERGVELDSQIISWIVSHSLTMTVKSYCLKDLSRYCLNWLSFADGGNFLCKKFHKTIHTLHSLITSKFNIKTVKLASLKQRLFLLFISLTSYCSFRYRGIVNNFGHSEQN